MSTIHTTHTATTVTGATAVGTKAFVEARKYFTDAPTPGGISLAVRAAEVLSYNDRALRALIGSAELDWDGSTMSHDVEANITLHAMSADSKVTYLTIVVGDTADKNSVILNWMASDASAPVLVTLLEERYATLKNA